MARFHRCIPKVPGFTGLRHAVPGRVGSGADLYVRCPRCRRMVHAGSDSSCMCGHVSLKVLPDGRLSWGKAGPDYVPVYRGPLRARDGSLPA